MNGALPWGSAPFRFLSLWRASPRGLLDRLQRFERRGDRLYELVGQRVVDRVRDPVDRAVLLPGDHMDVRALVEVLVALPVDRLRLVRRRERRRVGPAHLLD